MAVKSFHDAVSYIESLMPSTYGLERMTALAEEMGNPQDSYPIIHIGGTAGKGSTATMAAAILQEAGYKVGLHVSPHLEDMRERAQVNGQLMSEAKFVNVVKNLKEHIGLVSSKHEFGMPSYFEALVMLAFEHFERERVDVAVIEVGLGGTLDGTNIVKPKVAVLTNVGLDHTEILGDTVEEIASDKVGIFKEGIDVVSGVTQGSVIKIVEKKAMEMNCRLDLLGRELSYSVDNAERSESVFDLAMNGKAYREIKLAAVGEHQVGNAALAIDAVMKLQKHGFDVGEQHFREALKKVKIPGRFETVSKKPIVILDGAHNVMKIGALVDTIKQLYPGQRVRFVFAAKKGKRVAEMLAQLSPLAKKFYFCRFEATTDFGKRMAIDPRELAGLTTVGSEVFNDSLSAYRRAAEEAGPDEMICVTGSLYEVGELRSMLARGGLR